MGGLGLKDLKIQGIALAAKWIFHALDGMKPWKVLIRNNIERGVPKNARSWKALPLANLVAGHFLISMQGSYVFKSIWKAWEHIRHLIDNPSVSSNATIHGERSIWWNLLHANKPLALTQGCLTKLWSRSGIRVFEDLFENGALLSLEELNSSYNLSPTQKRTYHMVKNACAALALPTSTNIDSHRFLTLKWKDGSLIPNTKCRAIYDLISNDDSIIKNVNILWYLDLPDNS